jgi:hypothetical protein
VPTQSTGEQSRDNLRRQPINPPLPRQPGNTGVNPIVGRPAANPDPTSAPTRFAAPVAKPPTQVNPAVQMSPAAQVNPVANQANPAATHVDLSAGKQTTGSHSIAERFAPNAPSTRSRTDFAPEATPEGGGRRASEPSDWTPEPASDGRNGNRWNADRPNADRRVDDRRHGEGGHANQPYRSQHIRPEYIQPEPGYVEAQSDAGREDSFDQGGRHGSGSYEPVPRPVAAMSATPAYASAGARSGGRRAKPEPAGAHTAGRSVTELLAAHSSGEDSSHRHRRRAD